MMVVTTVYRLSNSLTVRLDQGQCPEPGQGKSEFADCSQLVFSPLGYQQLAPVRHSFQGK